MYVACSLCLGLIAQYAGYEPTTVKPVCNDQLYHNIYYMWLIQ